MFDDLSGKSVLITGASSGIGAAVARGFGGCGARVGVHYHNSAGAADEVAAEVRAAGGEAALLQGDVTDTADVARIIEEQLQAFRRLDVLINNAGDVVRRSAFENLSEQLIDDIVALNARSVVTACRLAAPHGPRQRDQHHFARGTPGGRSRGVDLYRIQGLRAGPDPLPRARVRVAQHPGQCGGARG
jgi:NAD(P)-dependent dehydrogenase (short-subunit alcohol dehydrogenase family)